MAIKSFQEILAWQKSRELTGDIYKTLNNCRDFGFKDQIQRAAVSIMNNTAEGYAKNSNKSFRNYLLIAKGSAAEVESMIILAGDLNYLNKNDQSRLLNQVNEVSMILTGFIRKLQ